MFLGGGGGWIWIAGKINEKFGLVEAARQNYIDSNAAKPNAGLRLHVATILPLVYDSMRDWDSRHKVRRRRDGKKQ